MLIPGPLAYLPWMTCDCTAFFSFQLAASLKKLKMELKPKPYRRIEIHGPISRDTH